MDYRTIWAPVPFKATYRHKGRRSDDTGVFYRLAPLQMGFADAAEAPVLFEINRSGARLRWRNVGGRLMREIHLTGGLRPATVPFLKEPLPEGCAAGIANADRRFAWLDYPFRTDPGPHRYTVAQDADAFIARTRPSRWADDWTANLARASALAPDLVVCDDVLLRSAAPPALAVRLARAGWTVWLDVWVEVAETGLDDKVYLPMDAGDAVEDMAACVISWLNAIESRTSTGERPCLNFDAEELTRASAAFGMPIDPPQLFQANLVPLALHLGSVLAAKKITELPARLVTAFGAVVEAAECHQDDGVVILEGLRRALELAYALRKGKAWTAPIRSPGHPVLQYLAMLGASNEALEALEARRTDEAALAQLG